MQVGLAEMKPAVEATGGMVVQTDTFLNPVFKESFKRVFAPETEEGYLAVASNATFEVRPALLARLVRQTLSPAIKSRPVELGNPGHHLNGGASVC